MAQPLTLGLHRRSGQPVKRNAPAGNDLFVDGLRSAWFKEHDGGTGLVNGQPQQPGTVSLIECLHDGPHPADLGNLCHACGAPEH
ncbi:hypothetical protein D9M72_546310 [compost metagenome]